jgi:hypothetical protein
LRTGKHGRHPTRADLRSWPRPFQGCIEAVGAKVAYIAPASPVGNGLVKIFHAPLRDGLLDREARFEGPIVIETWRRHYNIVRPLASFSYRPPAPELFVAAFAAWHERCTGGSSSGLRPVWLHRMRGAPDHHDAGKAPARLPAAQTLNASPATLAPTPTLN